MKRYLLLLCAFGTYLPCFAQNSDEISTWASLHPEVYLISSDVYNSMDQSIREKLAGQIIIYNGEITIEQLETYTQTKSSSTNKESDLKNNNAQELKDWLMTHSDVKIVPRSEYDNADEATKELYVQYGSLILIGEAITTQDIRNYNH